MVDRADEGSTAADTTSRLHLPRFRTLLVAALVALGIIWLAPMVVSAVDNIDLEQRDHPASVIFAFVVFDAIIPIFPSESLLTTASNLAAQTGSSIELWRVILAGAAGATVGDSILYWLSRTVLRRSMSNRLSQAEANPKVAQALAMLGSSAPLLIVFGRFVPGLRFVVGATMGLTRYPYRRFLLWDAIGGTAWAGFTCLVSYAVASLIEDKPIVSILMSAVVTTALLALLYKPIKQNWQAAAVEEAGIARPGG